MRRRRKYDIYFFMFVAIFAIGYLVSNHITAESRGVEYYSKALEAYKASNYEKAYQYFGKVAYNSTLKPSALFRQARCATNMGKKELAIKKYKRIVHSRIKSSILPISQYNMANLMFELEDSSAKGYFKKIIKKYPTSDYAIASNYFLGLIELSNLPENPKRSIKAKNNAFVYFKNYIEGSAGGRYSINSIDQIKKLDVKLNNYDNLLIAKSYYANGEYQKASDYLNRTTFAESWSDFVKNEYKLGNKEKSVYYAEKGLKNHSNTTKIEDIYEVIDLYVAASSQRKEGIKKLVSYNLKSNGADYIDYLNCNEVVASEYKEACYRSLYEKYPNGQFSAESLYNIFMSKYLQKRYFDAQRLGILHIKKFPGVKSSPAVTYFMGKIAYKLKHYESANNFYKQVQQNYPDSYYAYRANYNLYQDDGEYPFVELKEKPVVFPYKKSLDKNLVVNLAYLQDYDLVEELCKNDKFIQSWVAYQRKNYTISAVLARNAMEELNQKPDFEDLRWRLVYPMHYYDIVERVKGSNNPIILESIIKEESHFNPFAKSYVGATGLMQLMPATYNEVVKKHNLPSNLNSEAVNITAGSYYYAGLRNALSDRDLFAIAAYNGGIGSVTSWSTKFKFSDVDEFVEQIPYPETKNYVKKVLRTYWVYGNIYQ